MRDTILTGLAWVILATGAGAWIMTVVRGQDASIIRAHGGR